MCWNRGMERTDEAHDGDFALTVIGRRLEVGDAAPDFLLDHFDGSSMSFVRLGDSGGRVRVLNVLKSIDTAVGDTQTRRLASIVPADRLMTVSMDLPFALARWTAAGGQAGTALSAHRNEDFGRAYGVLLKEWRELQRSIFVIDADDRIAHTEYVADQSKEPDYDAAVAVVTRLS